MPAPTRTSALAFAADLVLVLVFVLIGRASHDENPVAGALITLWPFAGGLVVGWLVSTGWRHPLSPVRVGLPVWLTTVIVGMLLRAASGQGVQLAFVIVATVALGVLLVGWRLVAAAVRAKRTAQSGSTRL